MKEIARADHFIIIIIVITIVTASVEAKCYRFRKKLRNIFWLG